MTQIQIYRSIGESHGTNIAKVDSPDKLSFIGCYSRNPIPVSYTASDNGRLATYFARWMTRRGEVGPWSTPLHLLIFSLGPTHQLNVAA